MKILITGGHVTPALALLPRLQKKHKLFFVVRKYAFEKDVEPSFEYREITRLHIPYKTITAGRLPRSLTLDIIPSILKFPIGFAQSLGIIAAYKPDVVLSFGGYVGLPVCLAAFLFRIPIVTHEQTITLGLANKIIAFFAKKICLTFSETLGFVPKQKAVVTGNPIRKELFNPPRISPFPIKKLDFPIIYITGGSSGSHSINMLIYEILEKLLTKYIVIHQTGSSSYNDFELLGKKVQTFSPYLQTRYIRRQQVRADELAWIYANAKLLVGRSGANTVNEILAFGIVSILIPLPWAAAAEQEANARIVEKVGLGKILLQENLTANVLASEIENAIVHLDYYENNKQKAKKLVVFDAQEKIIDVVENVV